MAFIVNPASGDSDVLRIVSYPYRGASPVTLLDLNDGVKYHLVSGTFKVSPPERQQQFAMSQRRYGGGYLAQETHGNGTISAEWYVRGTTATQANSYAEDLLAYFEEIEDHVGHRYLAWQPSGATYPILYELRAATAWEPQYRWVEYAQTKTLHIAAGVQVAPLGEGLPMFIHDKFDIDSSADYTTRVGSDTDWEITDGSLVSSANPLTDLIIQQTDRGYANGDVSYLLHGTVGTLATARFGGIFRFIGTNNHVRSSFRPTATNTLIEIETVEAGVVTSQVSSAYGSAITPGTEFWYRTWSEGPRIYGAFWLNGRTPETVPDRSTTWTPTSTHLTTFGYGVLSKPAMYLKLGTTDKLHSVQIRPYRIQRATDAPGGVLGDNHPLDAPIPGSAPAKVDVELYQTEGALQVWGMLGWSPKFQPWNMVINGNFVDDADGWSVGATAGGLHSAGTSVTRLQDTLLLEYGQVVTPATSGAGVHYKIYRRFLRGETITMKMKVRRSTTGTASVSAGVGSSSTSFGGSGTVTVNGDDWTELTATWTPTGNSTEAFVYLKSEAATGYTLRFKDVRVYRGTVEPTKTTQINGRGGNPPFGRIKATTRDASRSTGWNSITEGSTDTHLVSSSQSPAWETIIDPSLLATDPFSGEETQLEVWGVVSVNSAPAKITASMRPYSLVGTQRFTNEWGSAGKVVEPVGSSGANWRIIRLGTISVLAKPDLPDLYRLRITFGKYTAASISVALREVFLVQPSRRALGPTGKANDSAYPRLFPSAQARKRIFHDLAAESGEAWRTSMFPDHGLGGSFIEFPAGDNVVFLITSQSVPDDPTGDELIVEHDEDMLGVGMVLDVTPRWFLLRD